LALDESKENDKVFDEKGLTYLIEKDLYENVKPIKVDFVKTPMGEGFNIDSNMKKESECGGSCSC
jgi:iron-sulfur cluster assembly protein